MALAPPQQIGLDAIKQSAAAHGVDWRVMAALAHHESNLTPSAVGDGGHAIGLFQLNNAGGVLTGKSPQEYQSYADPHKNADYAATALAKLGITKGSGTVEAQIAQGVNRFERPANKGAEISDATAWYRSTLAGTSASTVAAQTGATAPVLANGKVKANIDTPIDTQRNNLLMYVMGQNQQFATGTPPDTSTPNLQTLLTASLHATTTKTSTPVAALTSPTGQKIPVTIDPGVVPDHSTAGAIAVAKKFLGTAYHFGGASPATGFDCSGLLQYAYAQQGIHIPRVTGDQIKAGTAVKSTADLQPGDAIFFNHGEHVGMYIGNGNFIQAPHTGDVVKISKLAGYDGGPFAMRRYA